MQPWTHGVKARLVNLSWDIILSRGSVVAQLSDGSANLLQGGRVNFPRVGAAWVTNAAALVGIV